MHSASLGDFPQAILSIFHSFIHSLTRETFIEHLLCVRYLVSYWIYSNNKTKVAPVPPYCSHSWVGKGGNRKKSVNKKMYNHIGRKCSESGKRRGKKPWCSLMGKNKRDCLERSSRKTCLRRWWYLLCLLNRLEMPWGGDAGIGGGGDFLHIWQDPQASQVLIKVSDEPFPLLVSISLNLSFDLSSSAHVFPSLSSAASASRRWPHFSLVSFFCKTCPGGPSGRPVVSEKLGNV